MSNDTPAKRLQQALTQERPLQIVGAVNAYCALLAQQCGFKCLYLSGAGVANASFAKADLGLTRFADVLEDARRICQASSLPLLVDVDTGFEDEMDIADMSHQMQQAGAAAIQIEDQLAAKRCGHRPGKTLVNTQQMCERLDRARRGINNHGMLIMARTDAYSVEGLQAAIDRCRAYESAGADLLFAESFKTLEDYQALTQAVNIPVLANLTEFGQTPLFSTEQLTQAGIAMALYPLSAFRAMNQAALEVYNTIRKQGTQKTLIDKMQPREALYQSLDYVNQEKLQTQSINKTRKKT